MAKKWLVLLITVGLLAASVIILNFYPAQPVGLPMPGQQFPEEQPPSPAADEDRDIIQIPELSFSHTEHFYSSDIEVSITSTVPEAVIYYTIDGSEPSYTSPVYKEPILLKAGETINRGGVYPLKAVAVYDRTASRMLVHTYFIGRNLDTRFDLIVFSLSTNDEYLYDYDIGIMVEGATRAQYKRDNPGAHIDPPAPANFNWRGMEGERPVYVEAFEPDGTRIIAQAAGLRVHGGWSRAEQYKSLRLIARKSYEPNDGKFKYDFFPEDVRADGFGTPLAEYDQLLLSNNANDRAFGMLRQEVNYALARKAGLRVTSPFRGAAVFLNGEYYGFAWLEVIMNEQYLEDLYNAPVRSFQIVGNGELWIASEDEDDIAAIEHFNSFYKKDFTDDAVMAEFEELVDVDNLMLYYAFQTYLGNRDWPDNNMKRWRYTGPLEEGLAPELDGRWRYVTYDLDFTLSLYEDTVRAGSPSFKDYMSRGNGRYCNILAALFARPEMADKYAMYVCDIAANIITEFNVAEQIDIIYGEAYKELGYAMSARKLPGWANRNSVEFNHSNMIKYAAERPGFFLKGISDYFGWDGEMFKVEVSGSDAVIGTQQGESSKYFSHLIIPVRPALAKHTEFVHWILNGGIIETPEITVSINDAVNGIVKLELVTREKKPSLMIKEAYGSSESNGAVLHNISDTVLNTDGLHLTYDLTNPYLFILPPANIAPGGVLEFAGRGSSDSSDILKIRLNFNVRENRVLYLCDENGGVIDWMIVNSS